ncbi:GMC family oxidoreductase N-terminal domain-containing protein [Brucella tritici]|uniref:GMC family oxidoreductase n=1 Tax=Brucella tritici TaxID=94626 RepID=A0A6L3YVN4_9HYPH|nr:GMC family oxidoreductase N-terminal domain-containing protein [Brucella tritici]KAB2688469.1 GMC family oxidoreductase [Brucella tritici]
MLLTGAALPAFAFASSLRAQSAVGTEGNAEHSTAEESKVEVVVIGSGFGGSIAARRLAEAGRNVVMLERGPWRDTVPNRSTGMTDLTPLPQGAKAFTHGLRSIQSHLFQGQLVLNKKGFVEAYHGKGINVICSSNVGGGSHIYAGMLARPSDPAYWDGRHPQISKEGMEKYYLEVIDLLKARAATSEDRIPNSIDQSNYDGKLSTAGLSNPLIGVLFPKQVGIATKITDEHGIDRWECEYRNNSILGSPSGAKTTLDFSMVWPAMQHGLAVRDLCEAESISKLKSADPDGMRYVIHYRNHRSNTNETILAKHVILAAGCLNTVRLLFKSRDIDRTLDGMPRLGLGFGTNGGFFAFWKENSQKDLTEGLPLCGPFRSANSTSKSVQVLRAAIQGIEDISMPPMLRRWLRRNSFIVALGKDKNNGAMEMQHGKFKITYDKQGSSVYQEIDYEVKNIQRTTGTKIYAPGSPLTVQPLGGVDGLPRLYRRGFLC